MARFSILFFLIISFEVLESREVSKVESKIGDIVASSIKLIPAVKPVIETFPSLEKVVDKVVAKGTPEALSAGQKWRNFVLSLMFRRAPFFELFKRVL
ncbi:unnamed protein product [Caenorhabditis angaria]|uniref:SXP/RAL-2 family protein Ani s 5-like cation-binding domain-containing protein n=1 Tax=Caenorhabditis angaria TaxID=860376 RepID=A0A9P1IKA1_9PELO|nr:unnamed protein product [Caenorhabditis angaria]